MKNCAFTVIYDTHCLANAVGPDTKKDVFQRAEDGAMIWSQAWFFSAFTKALKIAGIRGIKPADINMDLHVKADTKQYVRRYGEDKFRTHEAIFPGTRVQFRAVVADHVTESNLTAILTALGRFVGLSPYGFNLGLGRFSLESLKLTSCDEQTV